MSKRYQVFLSSTFADLQEERKKIFNSLMKMDCIPAGMELFPAADDEQFEFIKKVIDDCDYYVLVIGGRYGTVASTGISYTEMEFDYACSRGVHVLSFLHKKPGDLKFSNSEPDDQSRLKLTKFRERASERRLVDFWETGDDLANKVVLSLLQAIKVHPAVGWVRADKVSNEELLTDINKLRRENEEIRKKIPPPDSSIGLPTGALADFGDFFTFEILYAAPNSSGGTQYYRQNATETWGQLFGYASSILEEEATDSAINRRVATRSISKVLGGHAIDVMDARMFSEEAFETMMIQFRALGLLAGERNSWRLSRVGMNAMLQLRAVRKVPN